MIYTKTGDDGTTSLASGQRVPKTDVRVEAYGEVDELNSWVGMLRVVAPQSIHIQLEWVQNKLFNLGAALSDSPGEWITENDVHLLEQWMDAMLSIVPRQREFLLPAGDEAMCRCHICRTICRRAERRMIASQCESGYLRFINRLSDYFFVLARYIATLHKSPEKGWKRDISV